MSAEFALQDNVATPDFFGELMDFSSVPPLMRSKLVHSSRVGTVPVNNYPPNSHVLLRAT